MILFENNNCFRFYVHLIGNKGHPTVGTPVRTAIRELFYVSLNVIGRHVTGRLSDMVPNWESFFNYLSTKG